MKVILLMAPWYVPIWLTIPTAFWFKWLMRHCLSHLINCLWWLLFKFFYSFKRVWFFWFFSSWVSHPSSCSLQMLLSKHHLLVYLTVSLRPSLCTVLLSAVLNSLCYRGGMGCFSFLTVVDPFVDLGIANAKSVRHACNVMRSPATISGVLML